MHRLTHRTITILILFFTVTSASGKSSKLVFSWKNPAYVASNKFHRVLALGMSDNTVIRADFEDALAAQLAELGMDAIPGNVILLRPEGAQPDLQYIRTQIRDNEIDAVIVSRLIKVENTTRYVPGAAYVPPFPYYGSFYGYYGTVYPVVYSPGYLTKEKKVRIETNFYVTSSGEGELIWTCITETFNPNDVDKAIKRLVELLVKQIRTDGVL